MEDEVDYSYKYIDPRSEGAERRTVRSWLHVTHHYRQPYTYKDPETGEDVHMLRMEEALHPNFIFKIIAVLLFPASVLQAGVPEAWTATRDFIFDRKYGAFTSHTYYRRPAE